MERHLDFLELKINADIAEINTMSYDGIHVYW